MKQILALLVLAGGVAWGQLPENALNGAAALDDFVSADLLEERTLRLPTREEQSRFQDLQQQYLRNPTGPYSEDLLFEISELGTTDLIAFGELLVQQPDPKAKLAGLELLQGASNEEILPVLEAAWRSEDPLVRAATLLAAPNLESEKRWPMVGAALRDPSGIVRQTGLDALELLDDRHRAHVIAETLPRAGKEMSMDLIHLLQFEEYALADELLRQIAQSDDKEMRYAAEFALKMRLPKEQKRAWLEEAIFQRSTEQE